MYRIVLLDNTKLRFLFYFYTYILDQVRVGKVFLLLELT